MDRLHFEEILWNEGYSRVMGLDEAGRGCLSGPVVAAGVILERNIKLPGVRDSKKMTVNQRLTAEEQIKEKAAYWTIQWCEPTMIDAINILQASLKAMKKCVDHSGANPDYLLVDGNRFVDTIYPSQCLIGGDDRSLSIAAASVLAKVFRDRWMQQLHLQYPYYGWDTNVGYPTKKHYAGLKTHGFTPYHRRSFQLRTNKELKT
jgi:ribonuclease HII